MKLRGDFRYSLMLAAFLIAFAPTAGHACSCVTIGLCNTAWKQGEVIFLGEVTAKELVMRAGADPSYSSSARFAVHFLVREVFAGRVGPEKDTVVFTSMSEASCGYPFIVGQSYLVYASANQGELVTGLCTSTTPAVMAGAVMQQLRVSAKGQPATLFGMIGTAPRGVGYEDLVESKALSGVRVRALGSEGKDYSATSDAQGMYSFEWLPADSYRLEVDLPKGLSTWQQNLEQPIVFSIGNDEKSRGCTIDVFARPDGRVSGVVIDSEGKPVDGFMTIAAADPAQAEVERRHGGLSGCDTHEGKFMLWQLPPGRYRLIFYPKVNGQISFRGGAIRSAPIDLGLGQRVENFEFKINQ